MIANGLSAAVIILLIFIVFVYYAIHIDKQYLINESDPFNGRIISS